MEVRTTVPLRPLILLSVFVSSLVSPLGAGAQTASLVEDIETQEVMDPSGAPYPIYPLAQGLFFKAFDATSGSEPWATDGTVPGTRMLADLCQGSCDNSRTEVLGTLGGRLLWREGQIWSTDGSPAGTLLLTDPDLAIGYEATNTVIVGNRLYFPGCREPEPRCVLWSTDGTPEGTAPVPLVTPDPTLDRASDLVAGKDRLYYVAAFSRGSRAQLWMADAGGARRVVELPEGRFEMWTVWGNLLFFSVKADATQDLWVSDGTAGGTRSVASFAGSLKTWLSTGPTGLYFIADDIVHGHEIWRSDGTAGGTRRLTEFGYFAPFYLFAFDDGPEGWAFEIDGRLLFAADDHLTGPRLWTSTGTPGSTRAISESSLGSRLFRAGNRVFAFRYDAADEDCEVWSFDGRTTGTRIVDGLTARTCGPDTYWDNIVLRVAGSRVYFAASEIAGSRWSIWRSDGTVKGTDRLFSSSSAIRQIAVTGGERRVYFTSGQDLWLMEAGDDARRILGTGLRNGSARPWDLIAHQGKLFFTAVDGGASPERSIWSSEGSAEDTSPFLRMDPDCPSPSQLTSAGSSLVFLCDFSDRQLRRADPATAGGVLLAEEVPRELALLEHRGKVWFSVGQEGEEVWTSDGTPAGTARLVDNAGSPLYAVSYAVSPPVPFVVSDGIDVYVHAARSGEDPYIWRSDGTPAGTIPLLARPPFGRLEVARAGSTTLINLGELWRTDGSALGTVPLTRSGGKPLFESAHRLTAHDGAFYLYGTQGFADWTFYRTNGTEAGTAALVDFTWRHLPYDDDRPLPGPVAVGAKLFFVAADAAHGAELWVSDGTPAGTSLVADISPGSSSSAPSELVAAGGALWFAAYDPVHGRELWRTDGTAAGTRLVQDIAPEALSSSPEQLTVVGDKIFFSADDSVSGRELWIVRPAEPQGCQPSATALCLQGGRFRVEARWRDFQGEGGVGRAVPLSADTGTFWFFDPANVEVLLKVLDGRGLNGHFWVFYGALSSVEYGLTVTDTESGLTRRYSNPAGQLASAGDTQAFGPRGARSAQPDLFTAPPSPPALVRAWTSAAAAAGTCVPEPERLCLNGGRFAVEVSWKDFAGKTGRGTAVPFTGDTGYFWFFAPANVELAVKVLDGTPLNGKFWVFYGALSNVEYTLKVTDTRTGAVREYANPSGRFASVGDTAAF